MKCKVLLIWLVGMAFFACMNEEFESSSVEQEKGAISLYITTPDELQREAGVRAAFNGPHANEGVVSSLWLLVFNTEDENGKLLEKKEITYTVASGAKINGEVELDSPSDDNTIVRFLANMDVGSINLGATWSDIRELTYNVDNNATQVFPMTGEIKTNFRTQESIGSDANRVKLIRSMAKITFSINTGGDFEYIGNKVFNLKNRGFIFSHDSGDIPTTAGSYTEGEYNKNTVTYTPEQINATGEIGAQTPLEGRSYFILRGSYKNKEGYYRIEFYNESTKEYLNFKRNTNYNFTVTVNGYGYDTEEEAIKHPLNGNVIHVIADVNDAYNFITNGSGNFLGFSNLAVTIYGKPMYYTRGFSGNKTRYEYVFTTITNEKPNGWDVKDIVILNKGRIENPKIVVVDKYDELGTPVPGMKEYLLVGGLPDNFKVGEETAITIRYTTLTKEIKIKREQYIDSHFTRIAYRTGTTGQVFSEVRLTPSRKSDGSYVVNDKYPKNAPTHLSWVMLNSTSSDVNSRSTDYQTRTTVDQWSRVNGNAVRVQFHEHLDGEKMGRFAAQNAALEGFRFADVFATLNTGGERHKLILAQANADLAGFFGHENIRPNYVQLSSEGKAASGNYGPDRNDYNQYLVVERITDTYRRGTLAASIEEYCRSHSPSDIPNLWYTPSYPQLLGLWVADNSNSRRTSPFQSDEMQEGGSNPSPTFPYLARSNYKKMDEAAYPRINETLPALYGADNVPYVNFIYGETMRGYQNNKDGYYIAVRCVRNMDPALEPEGLINNSSPVSNHVVTMDPKDFLSDDYFTNDSWNKDNIRNNKVTRSFQVDAVYRSTQSVFRYIARPPGYSSYSSTLEPGVEGELTYTAALSSQPSGFRLPTMRELNLVYIYKDYLEQNNTFRKFNMDQPDGSGITPNNPAVKYPLIMRYPAVTGTWAAPTYFYWTSTLRNATLTYPMRMSMELGFVNTRGAGPGEDIQIDHRRYVKTVR